MRIIALSVLGVFLLYHVLTKSFGAYLADASPEAALLLNGSNVTALLNLAEDKLSEDASFGVLDSVLAPPRNAGPGSTVAKGDDASPIETPAPAPSGEQTPKQSSLDQAALAQIQEWAERAIAADPLRARAFRILGQISERTSDEMQTQKLMEAAVRRSHLESVAVYWMMRKSFQDQNYSAALHYADTLMRTRPQALQYIVPIMGKMAELPQASVDLKLLLSSNPPWRPQFFSYFPRTITDARTPLDILLSAKDSPNPPSADELRPYLEFLIQHRFYELAYYTWLQFLPQQQLAQAGHLYNGGFEAPPSGMPFDWVLTKGTGVTAEVAAKADQPGERVLHLQFGPGRVDYRDVTQLIMLAPGQYQFHGKYKGDLVSERGLEWRVTCAGKDQNAIGQGVVSRGANSQWLDLEFSFTVPEADCPAQYVKLVFDARSASEKFISGSIWFDDFKIVRDETLDASAATGPADEPQASEPAVPQSVGEPARAGETAVTPAAGGTTPETSIPMSPQAGGMEFKPKIYDPSMAPINLPPPVPQAQPPQ